MLETDKLSVRRRSEVVVDIEEMGTWAARLAAGPVAEADLRLLPWCTSALDLLPGWYDDWALLAREQIRLDMLTALVDLAAACCAAGRAALGVEAALLATSQDRLGEDAHRALITSHMADGNYVMAWRAFCRYRDALDAELGVAPNPAIAALLTSRMRPAVIDSRFTRTDVARAG